MKLTRQGATTLAMQYIDSALEFDDIVDTRKQKVNKQLYSCRLIGDSNILLIANNMTDVKNYINKQLKTSVSWTQADTTGAGRFNNLPCYAGTAFIPHFNYLVLYKLDKYITPAGQTAKQYLVENTIGQTRALLRTII